MKNSKYLRRPIRVLCAIGPGDVVSAFKDWKAGERTPTETSITYSDQTFDCLVRRGVAFWAVSSNARRDEVLEGECRVENRPRLFIQPQSALTYHLGQLLYAGSLFVSAIRFRASHVVVDSGTTHWFALGLFRIAGIEIVPNLHNTYWPAGHPTRGIVKRIIFSADRLFFRSCVRTALGVSPECGRQIQLLSSGRTTYLGYRPLFVADDFSAIAPPSPPERQVRVLFAGRITVDKGVFDLLRIAERVRTDTSHDFVFDICGGGPDFERLSSKIHACKLSDQFHLHGALSRNELLGIYARSHVVIVPTRSGFQEGFAKVCAEAVLSRRPFVTSAVVPALEELRSCAVEAKVDDPDDFADKILNLVKDRRSYQTLVAATAHCVRPFIDSSAGLAAAMDRCLFGEAHCDAP